MSASLTDRIKSPRCKFSHKINNLDSTGTPLSMGYTTKRLRDVIKDHPLLTDKESVEFKTFFRENLIKRALMKNKCITTAPNDLKICIQILECLKSKKSNIYYLLYDMITTDELAEFKKFKKSKKNKKSDNNVKSNYEDDLANDCGSKNKNAPLISDDIENSKKKFKALLDRLYSANNIKERKLQKSDYYSYMDVIKITDPLNYINSLKSTLNSIQNIKDEQGSSVVEKTEVDDILNTSTKYNGDNNLKAAQEFIKIFVNKLYPTVINKKEYDEIYVKATNRLINSGKKNFTYDEINAAVRPYLPNRLGKDWEKSKYYLETKRYILGNKESRILNKVSRKLKRRKEYDNMSKKEQNIYAFVIFLNNNIVPIVRQYEKYVEKNYSKTETVNSNSSSRMIMDFKRLWEGPLRDVLGDSSLSLSKSSIFNEVNSINKLREKGGLFDKLNNFEVSQRIENRYTKLIKYVDKKKKLCTIDPSIKCDDEEENKGTTTLFFIMVGLLTFAFTFEFVKPT